MSSPVAVQMSGIGKSFGAVVALEGVDLTVRQGETHALVGENGAGKTTLMRILFGAERQDAGTVHIEGREVRFGRAAEGISAGIGMVSQHYSIIPELSCLQNLMLGAEPGPLLNSAQAKIRAAELADSMGFQFDWDASAGGLSPAGAQKLEILKLLWRQARIMILDEPTAMLSPADSDALFESLRSLAEKGATILLVTHRLPEVIDHCQGVTVLRAGRRVASKPVAETDAAELAEFIVGRAMEPPKSVDGRLGDPVLKVAGLQAKGSRGDLALKGVSLQVRAGEIVGIAGVDGSGQRELFWNLAGVLKSERGEVWLGEQAVTSWRPRERILKGLRLIPEDRHEEGVVDDWPLSENSAIGLQRLARLSRGGWRQPETIRAHAESVANRFSTRHGGIDQPMRSLSGGNQQRFVAGRALAIEPRLILAFQPARGLDIEATRQVYEALREECAKGAAALVVSFDLDELLENCTRVVAMHAGLLVEPPPGQEKDRAAIGRLMVGTRAEAQAEA